MPEIIFQNDAWAVINKPAGLDSQNSRESRGSVVGWLREKFGYSGLVHRLDLNTTGLMVCAKSEKAARELTKELAEGRIGRSYTAVVFGKTTDDGQITHDIEEKPALTRFRTIETFPNATLVEIDLETGRKHQIRRHFALDGHPLLGDHLYKKGGSHLLFHRPALHAHKLDVLNRSFFAPLPSDLLQLISRLRNVRGRG